MFPQAEIDKDDDRRLVESDALFMSIGDGAIVTNENGEIARINDKALDLLRLKREDVVGKWYTDVIIAIDSSGKRVPNINRPITEVFLTGKAISARLNYRRGDGEAITVNLTVSAIMLGPTPIGAIEVFRDITKEVELEQAKDEFIALASHQLRTPATGVKQYIGMMLQGYAGEMSSEQRLMAQKAYDSNERQIAIINDLLQVARIDAGKIKLDKNQVNLFKLIQDVINEQNSKLAERKQHIVFEGALGVESKIDEKYLRMAIENLIDNASKYSPVGKSILVKLHRTDQNIVISVIDEGVGVDPDSIDSIFRKFYRLTSSSSTSISGTGLGLYWVKRIVDLHGGSIAAHPRDTGGTRFTIKLPHRTVAIKQVGD